MTETFEWISWETGDPYSNYLNEIEAELAMNRPAQIINVTGHVLDFWNQDGSQFAVEPCNTVISAGFREENIQRNGALHIISTPVATEEGNRLLLDLEGQYPGAIIVGSEIAAKAYPGRVASTIPAPGMRNGGRKLARADKFRIFEE